MGAYSSVALTRKESSQNTLGPLAYGASEMQGWRKTMEDTHIAARLRAPSRAGAPAAVDVAADGDDVQLDDVFIFGIFDGHGGREVAHFCKAHFAATLPSLASWPSRAFGPLLTEAFLRMDEMLLDEQFSDELARMRLIPSPERAPLPAARDGAGGAGGGRGDGGDAEGGGSNIPAGGGKARSLIAALTARLERLVDEKAAHTPPRADAEQAEPRREGGAPSPRGGSPDARWAEPPRLLQAGCTAIVACLNGTTLHVANAGDSRAVLCRQGGAAAELSVDHKPELPSELERITAAGGWVSAAGRVNGNLNLSRAIGDLRYKANARLPPHAQIISAAPDIHVIELLPTDEFVVLACDGIWDVKSSEQVVQFVRERLLAADEAAAGMRAAAAYGSAREGAEPACGGCGERCGVRNPALLSAIVEELFDECVSHNPAETDGIGADNMTALIVDLRDHCRQSGPAPALLGTEARSQR